MSVDLKEVFQQLTPPPGGLSQLMARMTRDDKRERRWPLLVGMLASGAVACACLLWVVSPKDSDAMLTELKANPAAARLAPFLVNTERETDAAMIPASEKLVTAVSPMPSSSPNVIFYWVASVKD